MRALWTGSAAIPPLLYSVRHAPRNDASTCRVRVRPGGGTLVRPQACEVPGDVGAVLQEGLRRSLRDLPGDARVRAQLWLDRRPTQEARRRIMAPEVHPATREQHLVEEEHGTRR